jgi:hypothetical protein
MYDTALCRSFMLQTQFVLGSGRSNAFSYLIGYGKCSPTRPQHRLASCAEDGACGVASGLMAQGPNPVQLKGKLGPRLLAICRCTQK